MKTELEEAAKKFNTIIIGSGRKTIENAFKEGANWQQSQDGNFTKDDLRKAYFQGWVTRERFDDLSPNIVYPKGLDYEEKQEYAFNLLFEKFKKK